MRYLNKFNESSSRMDFKEIVEDTFDMKNISIEYPMSQKVYIELSQNRSGNNTVNRDDIISQNIEDGELIIEFSKLIKSLLYRLERSGYTIVHFHLWDKKLQLEVK